jgi:hypothetical protein
MTPTSLQSADLEKETKIKREIAESSFLKVQSCVSLVSGHFGSPSRARESSNSVLSAGVSFARFIDLRPRRFRFS